MLKNHVSEKQLHQKRLMALGLIILIGIFILIGRLYVLQIHQYHHFLNLSLNNAQTRQAEPPVRGRIFDRHGTLLATNRPAFQLLIYPEQLNAPIDVVLDQLTRHVSLSDTEIDRFFKQFHDSSFKETGLTLKVSLSEQERNQLSLSKYQFPGIEISASLSREYPFKEAFAHVIGYVGRISDRDLKHIDKQAYAGTHNIGKLGIEQSYERTLLGEVGHRILETNVHGEVVREISHQSAIPGQDIHLTLDAPLQLLAYDLMKDKRGALIAISAKTGEVLTLLSTPSFDPNYFVDGISQKQYAAWRDDLNQPLFNRALQGQYPPASTLKPFMALAGLESGVITPEDTIVDPGYYRIHEHGKTYNDWKKQGHGTVNLKKAIAESCDTYFYDLSHRLGINGFSDFLKNFGFGQKTGLDIAGEMPGLVPDPQWKQRVKHDPWYPGETLITGIGQGYMLSTPLQLAQTTATLARRGQIIPPHLNQAFEASTSLKSVTLSNLNDWQTIHDAMRAAVVDYRGTAHRLYQKKYSVAAKTGTAQVFGLKEGETYNKKTIDKRLHDHTLFIAFAPAEDPEVVISVVLENESGSSKIAKAFLDHYFKLRTAP